ncbi:alpha/beta fold hydrolase [Streptomyces sp. BA2]|uniref:alpha/beta fold hydrolase n=1 Tax=Streptomyces sp. BA2 TaxID=436595 RepID=UPI0013260519|nr:alpha/beta hydrolase [Streptomyces sp. BA2]MWA14958.1 alpha/beta fold hydrolase [Streptomyces sp. BA2]
MELMVPVKDGEVWAQDSGGEGLPLVLLHPGVADSRVWDGILPRLSEGRRVIRYDARGYGRSPAPTASFSLVEDLIAVLDHFDVARAFLAGSSMGGATAIGIALRDPARVAGLALLVPGITGNPDFAMEEFTAEVVRLAEAGDMDGIVALVKRTSAAAGAGDDSAAEALIRAVIPSWFAVHPHQVPDPPAFDRLGELDVPCVLALGERDDPEVVRCNEEMAARIPGCRLVRLRDSDHFPTLREPTAVTDLVLEAYAAAR